MKALIIEDEAPAVRRLERLLQQVDATLEVVGAVDSVSGACLWLRQHAPPDLLFVDVQLADGLSFEIFRHVQVDSPVIFTTAFDEYAMEAFRLHSIDYLQKPISADALARALAKLQSMRNALSSQNPSPLAPLLKTVTRASDKYRSRFLVERRDAWVMVTVKDVAYFHSHNKLTRLVTHDGKEYVVSPTLEELALELDPQDFFRANRQFIVSGRAIKLIEKHLGSRLRLVLAPEIDEEVVVSRDKVGELKDWLNR